MVAVAPRRNSGKAAELGIGVVAGVIFLASVLSGGGGAHLSTRPAPLFASPPAASFEGFAAVQIVPAAATVADGENASFVLSVTSASPGCAVVTPVVVWELAAGALPLGALVSPTGTTVQFTAFPGVSGSVVLSATVEGAILCSTNNVSFGTEAYARVFTVPSLLLSGWSAGIGPVQPGTPVICRGALSGGEPPYSVSVEFGDGNSSSFTLSTTGPFSVTHQFALGTYLPTVSVTDPLGERVVGSASSSVLVASSLAAQVVPGALGPEVGVGFPLAALVEGGFPPYSFLWNDSSGDAGTGAAWSVPPTVARTLLVGLLVTDRLGDAVRVERTFPVAPTVSLHTLVLASGGDVGRPMPFVLSVAGGVGPFTVTGSSVPSGSSFGFTAPTAGNWTEALVPLLAAPLWASLSVTDALGVSSSLSVPLAPVHSSPFLLANLTPSLSEVGGSVEVVGLSGGGTPPLNWSIATTAALSASSPRFGSVSSAGLFSWEGKLAAPGVGLFVVTLVDASGAAVSSNLTLRVLEPVASSLLLASVAPSAGEPLSLSFTVGGGAPPYRYALSLSDGETAQGNLSAPGPADWSALPRVAGYLAVRLAVSDSLGFRGDANLTVAVAPGVAGPSASPRGGGPNGSIGSAGSVGGAAGWVPWVSLPIALLLGLAWLFRGRLPRRPSPSRPESTGALPTVRRLLRESDGLDEESLLLLAEEEGIEPESTRRALRRWVALGRAEGIEEGDEPALYRWTGASNQERPSPRAARGHEERA
ncbi:MAG: hypothetical protein L3K13_02440 [Thermoplasmata archaeon]|nr:hypothetical protein [Thermoplasmata archaeon]